MRVAQLELRRRDRNYDERLARLAQDLDKVKTESAEATKTLHSIIARIAIAMSMCPPLCVYPLADGMIGRRAHDQVTSSTRGSFLYSEMSMYYRTCDVCNGGGSPYGKQHATSISSP